MMHHNIVLAIGSVRPMLKAASIQHRSVVEVAVVGKPDLEERTEIVKAYVALRAGIPLIGCIEKPSYNSTCEYSPRFSCLPTRRSSFIRRAAEDPTSGKVQRFLLRRREVVERGNR